MQLFRVTNAFFTQMKNFINELGQKAEQIINKKFYTAALGYTFLTAIADGNADKHERKKFVQVLQGHQRLSVFAADAADDFQDLKDEFEENPDAVRIKCREWVSAMKGNQTAIRVLLQLVAAVGAADGNFDQQERNVIRQIGMAELGLSVQDFESYNI